MQSVSNRTDCIFFVTCDMIVTVIYEIMDERGIGTYGICTLARSYRIQPA